MAVYHDAVSSIRESQASSSKYEVLILKMLVEAHGGQIMEGQMKDAAMTISKQSRDNASRGVKSALAKLKGQRRIREGIKGTWMLAD